LSLGAFIYTKKNLIKVKQFLDQKKRKQTFLKIGKITFNICDELVFLLKKKDVFK